MSILALDIGTSGIKATLVEDSLEIIDSCSVPYETRFSHHSTWAEQNPLDWWEGAVQTVQLLLERNPAAEQSVSAIGVSGHMMGLLAVDSDGEPLYPAMIHADGRGLEERELLEREIGADRLYALTGNVLSEASPLCKAMWLKKNEPALYQKTARFLQSKDYLVSRLTGNIDSTDLSDASHAMLIHIGEKRYLNEVFNQVGLDSAKFPQLHRSSDVVGRLLPEPAGALGLPEGIPVVAGGGDGSCASVGAGVAAPGDIYCSLGTTAWIAYEREQAIVDPRQRVFNILALDGDCVGVFGTTQCGGRVVTWAQELFGLDSPKALDRLASTAPAGCEGLILLPYLEGERSPIFDTRARGNYFGISPVHKREHFLRAALEGTCYALNHILSVMREQGDIPEMRIIGGGSKSPFWKGLIADICSITLSDVSSSSDSATSLGAAIAAGVGVGLYPSIKAAASQITVRAQTVPQDHPEYRENFRKYVELYPRLKPIYRM